MTLPNEPIRVLELRSVRGTGGGPEKTILLSAAAHDPRAVRVTVCYIRDARDTIFQIDTIARQLGIDYLEVPERHSFDPSIWSHLVRVIRDRRIQVVHAHEYKTDLLALLLARATGTIPLATVHGWSGDSRRQRLYYYCDRKLLRFYPLVITVSEPFRQTLLAEGLDPARVRRITNGIDHEVFRRLPEVRTATRASLGVPLGAIVVGAVGRLEPEKRFDLLIRAAAGLMPQEVHVVIAGEGSERPRLEALARQLGIVDRVQLPGHRSDALSIHNALDVYVQTSVREGIPNALLEAMAVETPIVATEVGGTSELIIDRVHGLLVPSGDVAALTDGIVATLVDPDAAALRTAAARRRVEMELSFAARLATIERVYAELVAAGALRTSRRYPPHGPNPS